MSGAKKFHKKQILVVDDEPDICDLLAELLAEVGVKSFTAHSAEEALAICQKESIDLVISDIRMPVQDGIYLLGEIKAKYGSTKVWLMSGYSDYSLDEIIAKGALGLLNKPFHPDQFYAAVKSALES